jgi:hypothetical protein
VIFAGEDLAHARDVSKSEEDAKIALAKMVAEEFAYYVDAHVQNRNIVNKQGIIDYRVLKAVDRAADSIPSVLASSFWASMNMMIDQTTMINGDPAFYKNFVDLTKRVQSTYSDGIYLNIRNKKDLHFNAAIINDVEEQSYFYDLIESSFENKGLAESYKKANKGDGFGMITPKRWLQIMKLTDKITPQNEALVQKMIDDPHALTQEELKSAKELMKPIKGVYYHTRDSIGRSVPVYFKYSQAVIIPGLSEDLDRLLAKMEKEDISEVVFESGIKVGGTNISNITVKDDKGVSRIAEDPNLNKIQYSNLYYKIQQDLPNKGYKSAMLIASQIQKNILNGVKHKVINYDL